MSKIDNPCRAVKAKLTLILEDEEGNMLQKSGVAIKFKNPDSYWERFEQTQEAINALLKHEVHKFVNCALYQEDPREKLRR